MHLREAIRIEPGDNRVRQTLAALLSTHMGQEEEARAVLKGLVITEV